MRRGSLQVVPFCKEHIDAAAALAARRFARLREGEPLLPARYASPSTYLPLLSDLTSGNPAATSRSAVDSADRRTSAGS